MAVTESSYVGNGSLTNYSFTFPYLKSTDIEVQLDASVTTNWSLANATTIQFTAPSGGATTTQESGGAPKNNVKIKILRKTNVDSLAATFYAGSAIKSEDLNDNSTQNLYATQEINDRYFSNTGGTMTGDLTLGEDVSLIFEGATDDAHETTITVADPTADRTITFPNVTGNVVTTGDTGTVTSTMITDGTISNADVSTTAGVEFTKLENLDSAKILVGNGSNKAAEVAVSGDVTIANTGAVTIATGAVEHAMLAADAVDGDNIADNSVDSEHYVDGSIDDAHIANSTISAAKLAGGITSALIQNATIVAEDIANSTITGAKIANDTIDGSKIADNAIDSDHYTDLSIDTIHLSADCVDGTKIVDDAIGAEHISANAVTTSELADAELTTLAGMPSATASILASGTDLTSTIAELNILDGKSFVTSVSGSSTNVQIPSAAAVNAQIVALIQDLGGFVPIADKDSFPEANPDPNNDAGTIISIADAGGLVVNGSGVSTTGDTITSNATVTINGIDSTLHNTTIAAGKGMLVQTTSTLNTYDYHRLIVDEAGVAAAQTLVTDFNQRYQVTADSTAPTNQPDGTALAEGDLWFDGGNNKMKVYNGSQYDQVTSIGDYKLLTVVPENATSGTPDYTNDTFDLRDGGNAANVTSPGQLIVSVNGVIQKPNTGTSAPAEGFALEDAHTIVFGSAPGSGASVFVTLIGSATTINVPGDNSVSSGKIQSAAVETAKIANNAVDLTKMVHGTQGGIIYYAASGTPTELAAGTSGYYLKTQGSGANPVWAAVSQYSTPLTTRGDILFRDASGDQRLAKGTAGQFLKIGANDPEWADVPSGVTGGGTNKVFLEFEKTIDYNYTITDNHNALTAGPVTIAATGNGDSSAVVVTVGDGETWTIV